MRIALAGVFVLCCGLVGCNQTSTGGPAATPRAGGTRGLVPADIKLVKGDAKALEAMIAAHQGQVVFVDYWALWCHPCVEFFPHTVELHNKFKDQGLSTVAVTFDEPDQEQAVRKFLADKGADFANLLSSYDAGPAAFEGFGIDLVPHFRLYDRQGKLRHKWDAKPDDAEQRIQELLAEK